MSPRRVSAARDVAADAELRRASIAFGQLVRDARLARGWSVRDLADRARVSADLVYRIEAGGPASSDAWARVAVALGRRIELALVDPRRRAGERATRDLARDLVHSAMAEFEARHLRACGFGVGIDEPYQHYQFAGRADLVAWDLAKRAVLHVENRTRFPDFQEMAGAYNAKRAYLAASIAERLGIAHWASETHVIAGLWSAEVLHALRLRPESFRSICPDDGAAFSAWWSAEPPGGGSTSSLILLDPLASGRERPFVGIASVGHVRPRHGGYADVARRLAEGA